MLNGTPEDAEAPKKEDNGMLYQVEDVPPWYLSATLGLQHYLTMFSGAIAIPFLISSELCMADDSPYRGHIISTTLFTSGIATFLQATFGCRLPIMQGPSLSFLVPTLAILSQPQWDCPSEPELRNMTQIQVGEVWMSRMREVQGAIIVGSIIEVLVGLTGLMGFLLKWITPLSIVPTITLIGLSLFKEAARQASGNWWIAALTMALLITFSQFLANVTVPRPAYSREKGIYIKRFSFFKLFSVILTIFFAWGLCGILTISNAFSEKNPGRTDLRLSALKDAKWFLISYPGQWGMPTFNVGPALGVIAGVVASAVESVGDYYACAKLSGAPPPPIHAVNRGIMVEGIGSVLSGFCGTGSGLTSFSQNIGAIAITKVGSRRIIQYAAVIITLFGFIGKFGVLFVTIPGPIMGGIFCIMFAIITGVGLSSLQYINLNSSRNVFILGFSLFMGLCIPNYLADHPEVIQTGSEFADQIIGILLKTSMFVGGFIGCLLDNLIPASEEERGLTKWRAETMPEDAEMEGISPCYNMPFGMNFIKKIKCFQYFPISPTYSNKNINLNIDLFSRRSKKKLNMLKMNRLEATSL